MQKIPIILIVLLLTACTAVEAPLDLRQTADNGWRNADLLNSAGEPKPVYFEFMELMQ